MDLGFVALGLVQGSLAGLNALGFTLLWRTTRVVNLAQPAVGLVGGVLTGMLVAASGWGFWWAAPLGVGLGALLGFASERLVLTRLATLPRTVSMVATIGLAALFTALQSGIPFFFGGRLPSYDVDIGVEVFVFPVLLKGPHLLALAALPVATGGLWWFVHRTRVGAAAVAAGQDLERAQALGVHAGFVRAVAWTLAGALSGFAGVLSIPVLGFSLGDGVAATVILLSLAPAVLAGLRSLPATAVAALVVGVGYQYALVESPTAGAAEVFLALVIGAALLVRRRPLERAARAARASSWAAATAPPPLPRTVLRDRTWRRVTVVAAVVVVAVAAVPPLWLSPSADVRYGTSAAFVVVAVAVATAWMFSGELALGHWGVAALGATVVHAAPGPLLARTVLGLLVGAAAGLALGLVARRRGGLAGAVAGLAIAVAAPYWLVRAGTPSLDLDPQLVACSAGAIAAAVAVGVTWLRGRPAGVRLVAARDEARRADGFGISPARALAVGMALSGALAAAAGIVYLAAVPAGVAPGAFDPARSFDVVAFAVVGGLGSAIGAGVGAAGLLAAGVLLPAPWASIATGAGVVWVVLFAPGGASSALSRMRDIAARAVCRTLFPPAPPHTDDGTAFVPEPTHIDTDGLAIVVGADTRDAASTPTVRAAAVAAWFAAGPVAAGLFGGPMMLADHLGYEAGSLAPWLVLLSAGLAVTVGLARWRSWQPAPGVPAEVLVACGGAVALGAFVATRDRQLVSLLAIAAPCAGAYVLAGAGRIARSTVIPRTRSAAAGIVASAGVAGLLGAGHLAVVAGGNDLLDAARWATAYLAVAGFALATAGARASADRRRSRHRMAVPVRAVGRRRWGPLRVESLTVDYRDHRILDGVDLEVSSGELVALVGGNGAGKSTLLRAIAGLVPVTAGRIDVAGHEITALRVDERAASGVAFVSGAHPVFPDMTVRENLRVGGYLTHRPERSFAAALDHVLTLVPTLADRIDTRAGLLSGGEQRQLAVAQMLFRRPALLLADELTLGLDVAAQTTVLRLLRSLADDGIGVVVVDHDLHALAGVADRVVAVRHGALETFDDPNDFTAASDELLPARFLASATR